MPPTLSQIEAEIAGTLSNLAANPSRMTSPILRHLQMLEGKRQALRHLEKMPDEVRGGAARNAIADITSCPVRDGEMDTLLGRLDIYGQFASKL